MRWKNIEDILNLTLGDQRNIQSDEPVTMFPTSLKRKAVDIDTNFKKNRSDDHVGMAICDDGQFQLIDGEVDSDGEVLAIDTDFQEIKVETEIEIKDEEIIE